MIEIAQGVCSGMLLSIYEEKVAFQVKGGRPGGVKVA